MSESMFLFGYKKPEGEVPCWWGARAILKNRVIDILWDRHNMLGTDEKAKKALAKWLNSSKGLKALQKLVVQEYLCNDEEREIRIEDTKAGYYIVANPNRSYGYLYIGAGKL